MKKSIPASNNFILIYIPQSQAKMSLLWIPFFSRLNITTVDPKLITELERDLSTQAVMMAIGGMQSGKSPGSDGFPSEFFRVFF